MTAYLPLVMLCAFGLGCLVGVMVRRRWWQMLGAGLLVAIVTSILCHLVEYFLIYPESKTGIAQWAPITLAALALWCVVPAILGVLLAAAVRARRSKTSLGSAETLLKHTKND
jgi:mannose/fructose/N-acetylgalactosamine-specific phosphotransferase system component IIC